MACFGIIIIINIQLNIYFLFWMEKIVLILLTLIQMPLKPFKLINKPRFQIKVEPVHFAYTNQSEKAYFDIFSSVFAENNRNKKTPTHIL